MKRISCCNAKKKEEFKPIVSKLCGVEGGRRTDRRFNYQDHEFHGFNGALLSFFVSHLLS